MDMRYIKAIDSVKFAAIDIKKLIETAPVRTFEDKQAFHAFENLLEQLNWAIYGVETFLKPAVEGKLQETDTGKFELISSTGESILSFSCGNHLEIYFPDKGEWFSGSVEHKNGKYYFYCSELDHPQLFTGMKARIRVSYI